MAAAASDATAVSGAEPALLSVAVAPTAQSPDLIGQIAAYFALPGAPATTAPTIGAVPLFVRLQIGDLFGGAAPPVADRSVVITGLFREMLRQDPTAAELQNYLGVWNVFGINGVVAGLYSSTALRQLQVNTYYLEMLARPATQSELSWGATQLAWGVPEPMLVASIAASPEFYGDSALRGGTYGTQPSATTFVDLLYRTLLGESADADVAPTCIQQLQDGMPAGLVAAQFVTSDAFRQVKVNEIYTVAGLAGTDPVPYVDNWFLNGGLGGIATEILTSPASVTTLAAGIALPDMTAVGQLQEILLSSYLKGATVIVDGKPFEEPPQFFDLVNRYLGVDSSGQPCTPAGTLCNPALLELLRTSGTDRGIPNYSVNVTSIAAEVSRLIPTQSEIGISNSLAFPLRNVEENGIYPLDTYLKGGDILHPAGVILTANNGTYVLDGHHRWSSIYVINPYTQIQAIDLGYVPSPQDGLKQTQLSIIARDAELKPQFVASTNLLDPNLPKSVFDADVRKFIYEGDEVRTLNVFANFLGQAVPLTDPSNLEAKLAAAQDYMWSNVLRLRMYNEPYPDVTNRGYMPQPKGNNYPPYMQLLETGAVSYTLPVISYLG